MNVSVFWKVEEIILWIFVFSSISIILVAPIVFNYIIVPEIEKKLSKKLEFSQSWYDFFLFGKFSFRCTEIISYILIKYLAFKFGKNPEKIKINPNFALVKVNYDIRTASNFEIFMSFFVAVNLLLFAICGWFIWYYYR